MSWWDRRVYKSTALAGNGNQGLVSASNQSFSGIKDFRDGVVIGEASPATPAEGNYLYAASGELISIDDNGKAWTLNPRFVDYTPTFSAAVGSWSPTIEIARYCLFGDLVFLSIRLTAGSNSDNTTYLTMTLPFTAKDFGASKHQCMMGYLDAESGGSRIAAACFTIDGTTTLQIYKESVGTILAGNSRLVMNGFYEKEP